MIKVVIKKNIKNPEINIPSCKFYIRIHAEKAKRLKKKFLPKKAFL